MKECINCGALLDQADVVCRYCSHAQDGGGPVRHAQPAQEPAAPPPPPPEPTVRLDKEEPPQQNAGPSGDPRQWQEYRQPYQSPPQGQQPPPSGEGYANYPPPPPYGQPNPHQPPPYPGPYPAYGYRETNRVAAGIIALFLGWLGIHKFYMGKVGQGIAMLLLCWTVVPGVIAFVEGIMYLCMDDYTFREKYCRLR